MENKEAIHYVECMVDDPASERFSKKLIDHLTAQQKRIEELKEDYEKVLDGRRRDTNTITSLITTTAKQAHKITAANTLIEQVKGKMQSVIDTLDPNDFAKWVTDLKEAIAAIEDFEKGRG